MTNHPDIIIDDAVNVARAIFSPQMIDDSGYITRAAFELRHNESYISVCQMNVGSWLDDIKAIPVNKSRTLVGYGILNSGDIRSQSFLHNEHEVVFDVVDQHTDKNKSHAGIVFFLDGAGLRGDKEYIIKDLPADTPAKPLVLRIQSRLLKLARLHYVKWTLRDIGFYA